MGGGAEHEPAIAVWSELVTQLFSSDTFEGVYLKNTGVSRPACSKRHTCSAL